MSNLSLQRDQPRHRIGRRAVHPDLSVPIHGHEAKGRIDGVVHDGRRDLVALDDRLPILNGGAAQRIDADAHARRADRFQIDDIGEVGDIGRDVVVGVNARRLARALIGNARDAVEFLDEEFVRGFLDPAGDVDIGRAAIGGIVFEAAFVGRIVRRADDDAVRQARLAAAIVGTGSRARSPASACSRRARRSSFRTPLAASTSRALAKAGSDSACVSMPRNSGPSMPAWRR